MKPIGTILLILGLATLAISLAARVQFKTMVSNSTAVPGEDLPLAELFIPKGSRGTPSDPVSLARATSIRIYAVGAAGLVSIIAGLGAILGGSSLKLCQS